MEMKQNLLNKLNIQDKSEHELLLGTLKQKSDEILNAHKQQLNEMSNSYIRFTEAKLNDIFNARIRKIDAQDST